MALKHGITGFKNYTFSENFFSFRITGVSFKTFKVGAPNVRKETRKELSITDPATHRMQIFNNQASK